MTLRRLTADFRLVFGAFVLLGAAVIVSFTQYAHSVEGGPGTNPAYRWMVLSVVMLMFIFGIIVWIRSRIHKGTDMDAEGFYYLGFIYTLVTLIATFYPM